MRKPQKLWNPWIAAGVGVLIAAFSFTSDLREGREIAIDQVLFRFSVIPMIAAGWVIVRNRMLLRSRLP
jgi:hypothetical protein